MKNLFRHKTLRIAVLIFVIGFLLRFSYLNRVPSGITDDELDFVLTGQSIFYTGKSLDGTFSPFSLSPAPIENFPRTRAPVMIFAPLNAWFHTSLGEVKIPYIFLSIATIMLLAVMTWKLFGERTALLTAFVLSVNPWSIMFGRTAYEAAFSIFFAYVFLFCVLYINGWWIILSIIPWIIGLYSYQGMIIVYPLLLIIGGVGVPLIRKQKTRIPFTIVVVIGLTVFFLLVNSFKNDQGGTRLGEIATPNSQIFVSSVNDLRRKSVISPLNSVVINKVTVSIRHILGQYLNSFSTNHLFISGETRSTFSLFTHGLFYPIEFFLLCIGIYWAYKKNKKPTLVLMSIILISPIPAAISLAGASFALRASLMYPVFCIFIALGIEAICWRKQWSGIFRIVTIVAYGLSIVNFMHIYFFQNPVSNSEGFGFSNRVLARYMKLASNEGKKVLFVDNNVVNMYRQYIFFSNSVSGDTIRSIQQSIRMRDFRYDTIQFLECPNESMDDFELVSVVTPAGKTCPSLTPYKEDHEPLVIAQLHDSGRMYEIYNDTICTQTEFSPYQPMITFDDLDVEAMPLATFCKTYISKPMSSFSQY